MAYNNYGPPPGAYGTPQPSYPSYPGTTSNFGPPPGMDSAPGMPSQSPGGFQSQSQFQAPHNMPSGINFNAPVIRLGVQDQQGGGGRSQNQMGGAMDRIAGGGGREGSGRGSNAEPLGNRNRLGLGADRGSDRNLDRERQAVRESMMALQPPTREEVARTIFIGGLSDGTPDDVSIESFLRCAGKLRRWTRVKDADDKACKFGFAEFEDVESLEAANEIFQDIYVPLFNASGAVIKDEEGEVKKTKLLVVVDEQSKAYIDEWKGRGRKEDSDARQFRIDGCKEDLRQCLAGLANRGAYMANGGLDEQNKTPNGDVQMTEANGKGESGANAEVITIPVPLEDELSDIPAEMRATVAEEIKAFRDRSNRRDLERMRREEVTEAAERQRSGVRIDRLASPPPSGAPLGPASAANGIPVGPRDRGASGIQGAPAGPRGYRGAQIPSDYINGVSFVGPNGTSYNLNREDEDAEESDEELERRRLARHEAELEKQLQDAERRILARERTRGAAQEREKIREEAERREKEREKGLIAKRLREWDDDEEARRGVEEYYSDRSSWIRKRGAYREREAREDDRDRAAEEREKVEQRRREMEARGMADNFMDQMDTELEARQSAAAEEPQSAVGGGFKMSLGSAAARTRAAAAPTAPQRKGMAEVENLLEDEEDAAASGLKRPELKPLPPPSAMPSGADMTPEERKAALQDLATTIPTTTAELFAYPVKWNYLSPQLLQESVRPFVEKKVVEFLGVQEDLLVDAVVDGLKERRGAEEMVKNLEDALEGEAEVLVRKVWRLVVFVSEGEERGLN